MMTPFSQSTKSAQISLLKIQEAAYFERFTVYSQFLAACMIVMFIKFILMIDFSAYIRYFNTKLK